jgi:hypothetical protein
MRGFTLAGNSYGDWKSISAGKFHSQIGLLPDSATPAFCFLNSASSPRYHVPPGGKKILGERRSRHQMIGVQSSTISLLDAHLSSCE